MRKRIVSLITIICVLLSMPTASYALSGKGTEKNPFRISTEEELLLLADFPECYFELENDIELANTWEPIADFSGSFDGKGHTITISDFVEREFVGFFGVLSGTVKNLTINANDVVEKTSSKMYIGLFAGDCTGTILNCKAIGSFTTAQEVNGKIYMGGFCGNLSGIIKYSKAQFELFKASSYSDVGGICYSLAGTVEECANMSNVWIASGNYGGISYETQIGSSICNSMNYEVSYKGAANRYAGIAFANSGTIINCYGVGGKDGTTGEMYKYGIASRGEMTNCFYDKNVLGVSSTTCGTPKSTIAMKMEATYTDWDFENVWGIDESEENPINDGYTYLKAFYTDFKNPATESSISVVNGKLVIDTKITDANDDRIVHIALYGENNKLCGYLIVPNGRELKDVFVVYPDNGEAKFAKVFTWDSIDTMIPVAECEILNIER